MNGAGHDKPVPVGIGLIHRDGRYLVRRRPPGGPMPGVWEFPGGKCEPGETPEAATMRECREEIGLDVVLGSLRCRIDHRYPHGWVVLSYFDGSLADPSAEPEPSTGFCWVEAEVLPSLTFPPANEPVIEELARKAGARRSS